MPISGFESFFLDKLVEYLKLFDKKFEVTPTNIIVKEKIDNKEYKVVIIPTDRWIRILLRFDNISDIPEEKRKDFLTRLLRATWNYPEINFALDDEGYIVSIQDEYVYAFYLDTFEEEYTAVLASINVYNKIKEEILGIKKSTNESKEQKEENKKTNK